MVSGFAGHWDSIWQFTVYSLGREIRVVNFIKVPGEIYENS